MHVHVVNLLPLGIEARNPNLDQGFRHYFSLFYIINSQASIYKYDAIRE